MVTEEQLPPAEITDVILPQKVHSSSSTPEVARSDQLKDAAASQTPKCSIQAVPYSTPISSPQPLGRQVLEISESQAQLQDHHILQTLADLPVACYGILENNIWHSFLFFEA